MICRAAGDELVLVTQTAHARLAADLGAEMGNGQFGSPLPRQPVLDAISSHDSGWPAHDDAPTINPSGRPAHALEMPLEIMLPIWSASTDLALAKNPYAGLLVSLHGLSLSARAHPEPANMALLFALNKFQHRQIELQEELRQRLGMRINRPLRFGLAEAGVAPDEDLLLFNFWILELADQLSLNLCFGESRLPAIEGIFPRPGQKAVRMRFECAASNEFVVDPWPFARDELQVRFPGRTIPARNYSDTADLYAALAASSAQTMQATLRRAK